MSDDPGAIADRVAEGVIAAVPQRLGTASSEREREAVFRLRYRTVIEMGWATPDQLPDGVERDDDDEGGLQVVARDGNELVGTARVVLPRRGRRLPVEREFGVAARPRDVEVGRTIVVPRLRGDSRHALLLALFAQCWLEMRSHGFTELLSAVPGRLVEVYRGLGFEVTELAPAREHWGEERFPVRFDVLGSASSLRRLIRD